MTLLDSRAGEPNWGPEILARHASIASLENLRDLYAGWERWAADVSESHSNYPVLIFLRSQEPTRNWLVGLLAVMDSAALHLALNPSTAGAEPRLAVRMGFVCLRDLADTMGLGYDPDPDPDTPIALTYEEYLERHRPARARRLRDGAHAAGGVAALSRLAGELRDDRLPDRARHRCGTGSVERTAPWRGGPAGTTHSGEHRPARRPDMEKARASPTGDAVTPERVQRLPTSAHPATRSPHLRASLGVRPANPARAVRTPLHRVSAR